ncbi:MAG: hypothetical protein AUJ31_01190 [Parcubacteria group bacterium CG1_02_39_15]|uniref:Uncharacterized protein n=2 Tax=Candidatus Nealsoniibacteriota TaxID=1817911 RepID=A0A2G9YVE5_9BACT|nr:hypothetical protein [Armatimonadota bacterium]OIO46616.1 MAG: hypothetical protein AUJ31_01190 [Parcubacteria group bacterium CG1_02_39_15]PIP22451.1 MAG: hypothetical protein COX38_00520 [Candidatus Nealsonbacteria bacterium CG23_combo_of_CG06-09_8_20_14_all_39_25]
MPSESVIRKKAVQILNKGGWATWYPSRARFKQNDIFGIIDLLAAKKKKMKKIQLTTLPNASVKRKKIKSFLKKSGVEMTIEIWCWDKKRRRFRKEKVSANTA